MGVYLPSASEFERENALVNDTRWQDERPAFLWLVEHLRSAHGDDAYRELLRELLVRLRIRQDQVVSVRADRTSARGAQKTLAAQQPKDVDELRRIGETLRQHERDEYLH